MSRPFTKNGKPLKINGDDLSDPSSRHVGRRRGDTAYGPDGKHASHFVAACWL